MEVEKKNKKINISIPNDLLDRIDEYADDNYLSRTAVICLATNEYLVSREMQKMFREMSKVCKRLAESDGMPEDIQQQLDEFQRLTKLMSGDYSVPPVPEQLGGVK